MKSILFTIFTILFANVYTCAQIIEIEPRISNGNDVLNIEDFNYQVGIIVYNDKENQFWCGGSIISSIWILTAAHCLQNKEHATVYFGTINRWQPEKGSVLMNVTKDNFIIHDHYSSITKKDDIALIKLNNRIPLSNRIKPINLIYNGYSAIDEFDHKDANISGWGNTSNEPKSQIGILQSAVVQILPENKCQNYYKNLTTITSTQICTAGTNSVGACKGDSGGPLVIDVNRKKYQIGVVSFMATKSCNKSVPRVYTRISEYLSWICTKTGICQIYMPKD